MARKLGACILLFHIWGVALAPLIMAPPVFAGAPQAKPKPSTGEQCPLSAGGIKVRLPQKDFAAKPGQMIRVRLEVDPPQAPAGFYFSIIADLLEAPEKAAPEVVSGLPEIHITAFRKGKYLFRIRVSLIAKSSCGGAKASIISEEEVRLNIS